MIEVMTSPWWAALFLAATGCVARRMQGSWLAPSAFAPMLWALYMALPLCLLDDRISGQTVWTIVALVSCMQIGAFLTEDPISWKKVPWNKQKQGGPLAESFKAEFVARALPVILVTSGVAFAGAALYAVEAVRRFASSFSWEGFLSVGPVLYGIIVAGEADPWWFRATRTWIFPAFFLGGMTAVFSSSRLVRLATLAGFVPALLVGATLASRYGVTMGIGCWISGFLAAKASTAAGGFRIGKKLLVTGLSIFALCVGLYVVLGMVRGHHYGDLANYSTQLRGNLFGYLGVFDNFVKHQSSYARSWGQYSAAGVVDAFGLKKRIAALSYEPVVLENGVDSNIFTAFRGLIQDFALPGALLLCVVLGLLAGRAYTWACQGKVHATITLSAFYSLLLWSPIVSIFNYNSVLLGLLAMWVVVVSSEAACKQRASFPGQVRASTA